MPFKTSMDPTQIPEEQPTNLASENPDLAPSNPAMAISEFNGSRISTRWFLGIATFVIIILLSGILAYAFHGLNSQDERIGALEVQDGITGEKIDSLKELIDKRLETLEEKIDDLDTLIREGK